MRICYTQLGAIGDKSDVTVYRQKGSNEIIPSQVVKFEFTKHLPLYFIEEFEKKNRIALGPAENVPCVKSHVSGNDVFCFFFPVL
jgi:hypothetical protein